MNPRFFPSLIALAIAQAILLTSVVAQDVRSQPVGKVVETFESDNVNELHVAVMGEVDTPGTYRLDSSSLKLHQVIKSARGFTSDASMAIRIIRQGRSRQKEIFSENSDSRVMPGDLLIVESKRKIDTGGKFADFDSRDSQTIRADYQEGTIRAGVQIALLNVLDYPLVLRLRPDQANVSYLVQALGQPISLLATARVITPDVPRRQTSDAAKRAARLMDGSVVVFEPGTLNRSRLPVTLPKPLDFNQESTSRAGDLKRNYGQTADLRSLGHHPFWSNPDPFESNSRSPLTASTPSNQVSRSAPNVLEDEVQVEDDSRTTVADSTEKLPGGLDHADSLDDAAEKLRLNTQSEQVPSLVGNAKNKKASGVSAIQFLSILLIVSMLTVAALFLRSGLESSAANLNLNAKGAKTNDGQVIATTVSHDVIEKSTRHQASINEPSHPSDENDAGRAMTIPIRISVDLASRRPVAQVPETNGEVVPYQPSTSTIDPAPTPLAAALLRLDQRRRA